MVAARTELITFGCVHCTPPRVALIKSVTLDMKGKTLLTLCSDTEREGIIRSYNAAPSELNTGSERVKINREGNPNL